MVGRTDPGLGQAGKDCYVYFNNDRGGHAPRDARTLIDLLRPGTLSPNASAHRRDVPRGGRR